ncbi:Crp/Fnr family transcriptional regulator [Sphingomonas insulae]|uniref:Crp/Fnr family transcriptional regulator n=1 Tax=Sphingomonas insulae TaxID=424800 RepID=A0ABP3T369_9SPHN
MFSPVTVIDRALLDTDRWFGTLTPERGDALIAEARVRAIPAGGLIYATGDAPNGLWAVIEGQVRLKGYPAAGAEFLALILRPGTWFGEVSTLDGGPRPHDAAAFGAVRVLHVPMAAFQRAAERMPALYHDVGRLVCQHQRIALDFIAETLSLPVGARLAKLLLGRLDDEDGVLHVRQEEVAVMLGVSRQTLNRHLRSLADQGAIRLAYARIAIVDRAILQRLARVD